MTGPGTWLANAAAVLLPAFVTKVDRDHAQSNAAFRRRRLVVAATLVVGALLLASLFSAAPGDASFYPLTLALAATWTVGSLLSGPLHLGRSVLRGSPRRPILGPILVGVMLTGVFVGGGLVLRSVPWAAREIEDVLGYARSGSLALVVLVTALNGVAEELFFRGALFAAIGIRHPVVISTALYTLATVAGGNPILVLAAAVLGAVVGLQRRATGGVLAPILTHVTWSVGMLLVLPLIFSGGGG